MPELAEVEFYRKRWQQAAADQTVQRVRTHAAKKTFREASAAKIRRGLVGARLRSSATAAKQMAFRFDNGAWLGVHELATGTQCGGGPDRPPSRSALIPDSRFRAGESGVYRSTHVWRAVCGPGPEAPDWWTRIAPALLSSAFRKSALQQFLTRRAKADQAVLLMQERFPTASAIGWPMKFSAWARPPPLNPPDRSPSAVNRLYPKSTRSTGLRAESDCGRGQLHRPR